MTRPMSSELVSSRGGCERCSKTWTASNAQALAAQHHDKTQHPVWVEVTRRINYGRGGAARASAEKRLL